MEWITQFFGRLHPLLVHFPIGILILAFLFECASRIKGYRKIRASVAPSLLLGAMFATAAAISGYFLSQEGGYEDNLLQRHKNLGIATAGFSVVVYLMYVNGRVLFQNKVRRKFFQVILFFPLVILISLTGHFGGSITHGEDYLFEIVNAEEVQDPSIKLGAIPDIDQAVLYTDVIQPILESRCYSCHSASKQKGKLRLDGKNFIEKGGESGHIIEAGIADSSALFSRLMLSLEDEDHMPPNEKPQPSSSEIALIQAWINEGADFEMKVSECRSAEKVKGYFISVVEQLHKEKLIPDEAVDPADGALVTALGKKGIIVLPVSKQSNYLSVSFLNKRSVAVEDLRALLPLKKQIIWLDLSRTTVSDTEIADIAQLTTLRRLNLEFTALSDAGLQPIASLSNLSYLNLVGTKISDKGLMQLSGLKNLQDLFVYQTSVTNAGIKSYLALAPKISIDSGRYHLPKLLTDSVVTKYNP